MVWKWLLARPGHDVTQGPSLPALLSGHGGHEGKAARVPDSSHSCTRSQTHPLQPRLPPLIGQSRLTWTCLHQSASQGMRPSWANQNSSMWLGLPPGGSCSHWEVLGLEAAGPMLGGGCRVQRAQSPQGSWLPRDVQGDGLEADLHGHLTPALTPHRSAS